MPDRTLIRCLGCRTIVNANRSVCPGCGRCLRCGARRVKTVKQCLTCELPYCDCCGRCPGCGQLRYLDVGPCECGHPDDPSKLESLIRQHAVAGAEKKPTPAGYVIGILVIIAAIISGLLGFFGFLW